jgi:hypothetical protein
VRVRHSRERAENSEEKKDAPPIGTLRFGRKTGPDFGKYSQKGGEARGDTNVKDDAERRGEECSHVERRS